MKHSLLIQALSVSLFLFVSINVNAQAGGKSNGRIPKLRRPHVTHVTTRTESVQAGDIAYGWSSINSTTLLMPIPAGTPFTDLAPWTPPVFASTAVRGPDGIYYVVDVGPPSTLWMMDPVTGSMTELGTITGIESGGSVNGIAYDFANNEYYLAAGVFGVTNDLYSFDVSALSATLVGSFPNPTGTMIDISIDSSGVGYGYDLITDDAWKFDPVSGTTTNLGPLGYDANYGQGMDIDQATQTIYLSAFNNTTITGQLRTMDPNTGATALIVDWGFDQVAPFAINNEYGPQPGPGSASNPSPADGTTNVDINAQLSWTNPSGAASINVMFGTSPGGMLSIYSGSPVTTVNPGTLAYYTNYYWRVDETDSTGTSIGSLWHFRTKQNPIINGPYDTVYTITADFATGNTEGTLKTDGEINTLYPNVAWAVFDISTLPANAVLIDSIRLYGYVNSTNWPYWSATPMGDVNPITDDAATINSQIQANYNQGQAYIFSDESSSFSTGWHNYLLGSTANGDLLEHKTLGWFAIGFVDRDFSTSYYVNFDGHTQTNPPYLIVSYEYCLSCNPPNSPSNLAVQQIVGQNPKVQLNWQDNSYDEWGFRILRKNGLPSSPGFYSIIGTTTTNVTQFIDSTVILDSTYSYGVRAYNQYGNSDTTNIVSITIEQLPVELTSFNSVVNKGTVTLLWQTATETNNRGFEVCRNQKTEIRSQNWRKIGFVNGNGTTTRQHEYNFADNIEVSGTYEYRLKQIDFNGTFQYSKTVEVEVNVPKVYSLKQNYPNPFNPTTKIVFSLADNSKVTLIVYDVLGRQIAELLNSNLASGLHSVNFNAANLASGVYFYKLEAKGSNGNNFISVKKMMLIR